jgi:predicted dehydrogenase
LSDLFISFAGRPVSLRATTAKNTEMPAAEDLVSFGLRFASGATGVISCISATPYYGRLTAFSRHGWLEVRESGNVDRGMPSELVVSDKHGQRTSKVFSAAPTVRANIEAWATALGGGSPYRFSASDIQDNARVFEGTVWSSRNGSAEIALDTL